MARTKGSRNKHPDYCEGSIKRLNKEMIDKNIRMCRVCGRVKALSEFEFRHDRHNSDGSVVQVFSAVCKSCTGGNSYE